MKYPAVFGAFFSSILYVAPTFATTHTICQQLLIQYGRMNAPRLPSDLHFHSWAPGPKLPLDQRSLGTLEFHTSQPGSITVETISGLQEQSFMHQRALSRILGFTPFAGFVSEQELKEVLEAQPVPDSVRDILRTPGLVHLVKRLPERYFLLNSETAPEQLRRTLTATALRTLRRTLGNLESLLRRERLTIDSPLLAVNDDGSALLMNFEGVRERREGEMELYLWREKTIVEAAIGH